MALVQLLVNTIFSDNHYYTMFLWPKIVGVSLGSLLVGYVGVLLNRVTHVTETEYEPDESDHGTSHTFFLIPVEYWAIITPVVLFFAVRD